jgi:hypothetical protein
MHARRVDGGWALLVVLVALAIVAFLARDALTAYLGGATRAAGDEAPRATAVRDRGAAPTDPAVQRPIERARAVEETVARGAADRARALDDQGR